MPRKVFVAGEILTAADVNTNLMDQSVMVFDDATARTTAIPTPVEGMVTYLKDTDAVEKFDGSNFVAVGIAPAILQVVSTTKTDIFSAATGADNYQAVTGLTATITPSSTSSKIYIAVTVVGSGGGVTVNGFQARLTGGTTSSYRGDASGSKVRAVSNSVRGMPSGNDSTDTIAMTFLDSPATTSAVTYGVEVSAVGASDTVTINRSVGESDNNTFLRGASTITVMEVAG